MNQELRESLVAVLWHNKMFSLCIRLIIPDGTEYCCF
jgi:hypothetical protein